MSAPAELSDTPPTEDTDRQARDERRYEFKTAGLLIAAMAVVGALLGVLWTAWSPAGPLGVVLPAGIQADENETFVAGDGRFVLITLIVGLAAGVAAWFLRRARGWVIAVALAVGGLVGAALTELVGWAVRGDTDSDTTLIHNSDGSTTTLIRHLPLTVHMHGLLVVEALIAALVYTLFVAFAAADDLGRPEYRQRYRAQPVASYPPPPDALYPNDPNGPSYPNDPSVGTERGLQDGWRHGDAAGPA